METARGFHNRIKTHCPRGHPLSGDNLYTSSSGRQCRICRRLQSREQYRKTSRPPSMEQIHRVTAALNAGETISKICGTSRGSQKAGPRIILPQKLRVYRQLNPDFDRFVVSAMADHRSKGQLRRFNREKARVQIVRAQNSDFHEIVNLVPVYLPPNVRDDIAQSIMVALLEGSLQRNQIRGRLPEFIAAHNRDANRHGVGKYGLRSIDAPAFLEGTTSFGETVSRGLWD
jgi:hypothetical protein